jgi:hypothetical protein
MPESRQRFSRREMASHLAMAEKMIAAGVNIQIRDEWREPARAQDQTLDIAVAGSCATFAFDLTAGRAGYVVSVRLVGQALGAVLDCRLATAWDDHIMLGGFLRLRRFDVQIRSSAISPASSAQSADCKFNAIRPWPNDRRRDLGNRGEPDPRSVSSRSDRADPVDILGPEQNRHPEKCGTICRPVVKTEAQACVAQDRALRPRKNCSIWRAGHQGGSARTASACPRAQGAQKTAKRGGI